MVVLIEKLAFFKGFIVFLNTFSNFSGWKPNKTKCETANIVVLNGVQVTLCGMKCVNLYNKTVKINNVEQNKSFCECVVKIKIMAHETFNFRKKNYRVQSLAVSKVIHFLWITKLHNTTNGLFYKIQENVIWQKLNIVLFATNIKKESLKNVYLEIT